MNEKIKQKSITKNLVVNGIKTLMTLLFPLITFPYASRVLGTAGIGKVNYAGSIISYFSLFAALGIGVYAIREGARIRDQKEKFALFAREMLIINLATTLLTYLALAAFLCLPILKGYKPLLIVHAVGIMFTTIGIDWLFVIEEEYVYIAKRAILFQCVSVALLFLLVRDSGDYLWYAALTVISGGGSAFLNLWYSRKLVKWKTPGKLHFRRHMKPILLIFGTTVASSVYLSMDTTMLGAMLGDDATGIYTAAVKINTIIGNLLGIISSTILPRVSYYIANGMETEYQKLMKKSMDMLLMIAMPAAIGMMCTSDILILFFSGSDFLAGDTAAKILSAKLVVGAINRILAYQICTPYKKDKEVLIATVSGAVVNLAANAVLIYFVGVTGAAIATLVSEIVVWLVLTRYSRQVFQTRMLYTRGPLYLLFSLWFFGVRYLMDSLSSHMLLVLVGTVGVCVIGYVVILFVIRDPYCKELMGYVNNRIHRKTKGDHHE